MIEDFDMTIKLAGYPNITELIVSRKVLLEMLLLPEITDVRLNIVQESLRFRFLHSVRWRGKLFIHPSERRINRQPVPESRTFAEYGS